MTRKHSVAAILSSGIVFFAFILLPYAYPTTTRAAESNDVAKLAFFVGDDFYGIEDFKNCLIVNGTFVGHIGKKGGAANVTVTVEFPDALLNAGLNKITVTSGNRVNSGNVLADCFDQSGNNDDFSMRNMRLVTSDGPVEYPACLEAGETIHMGDGCCPDPENFPGPHLARNFYFGTACPTPNAYYPFNGNANDASGNSNDAQIDGATLTKGISGQAYDFDGVSSYIDTPLDINLATAPELTMAAWVYPRTAGGSNVFRGRRQVFSHDDGGFDRSLLMQNDRWHVFTGGRLWGTGVPVELGAWQHVAVVFGTSDVRFFKNGVRYSYGGPPGTGTSANSLRIGENPGRWREFFDGIIDEVHVYSRALSTTDIKELLYVNSVNDSFTAGDGTNLDGWTPDVSENGSAWEVIKGAASIRDRALAFRYSGGGSTPLLNARNVIQEIEFDFTLGGNNAFWFYPLRTGQDPRTGFGFWVNKGHFDFKKFTAGRETAVRTIRMNFDVQRPYTAKFAVRGKRVSLYIKKKGGRYGPDLLNVTDPDYRYLTYLGFARSSAENERLRIDNVKVAVDPLVRDSDGDGVADPADAFPRDPTETVDTDGDGRGDNADAFPKDPGEWADTDGDGVGNNADAFPRDPSESKDSDRDGVGDNTDVFPKDPAETQDSDKDGVGDNADAFPKDPAETKDSDKDGIGDNTDAFPKDPTEHRDRDGDGVGDNADAFPRDPSESKDSDGDGVGDNTDAFPSDPSEHRDRDGDGVGDNADAFPRDPSESKDSDGDGVGDNADVFPRDPSETQDSDGDGVGDNADAFPDDPKETEDSDGDGLGDGLEGEIGSDPLDADTDDDGLDDGFEHDEGLDPSDGSDCPEWICGVTQRGWRLGM